AGDERGRLAPLRIEDHFDELLARPPGIAQERRGFFLEELRETIAQPVERGAQRSAPVLPPARHAPGGAPAVAPPALDAVGAAPGGAWMDLRFARWREHLQRLGEIDELHVLALGELADGRGEHFVAALLVVAEGLAVDGHGERLVVAAPFKEAALEAAHQ